MRWEGTCLLQSPVTVLDNGGLTSETFTTIYRSEREFESFTPLLMQLPKRTPACRTLSDFDILAPFGPCRQQGAYLTPSSWWICEKPHGVIRPWLLTTYIWLSVAACGQLNIDHHLVFKTFQHPLIPATVCPPEATAPMANMTDNQEARDTTQDGSRDFWGRVADKRTTGRWRSAPLIFVVETCERMSTLGIAVNLVTYLSRNMHLGMSQSANIVTNFLGTSYMCCLVGGFLADAYLGRFRTILISSLVQCSGMILLALSTTVLALRPPSCASPVCEPAKGVSLATLFCALYMIALGTGGIKSSVSAFGADQFDENDPYEKKQLVYYFNAFFCFISLGSMLAVTLSVVLQEKHGRGVGYVTSAGAMLVAIIAFLLGSPLFRYKEPAGSPLVQVARVLIAAVRKRHLELPSDSSSKLYDVKLIGEESKGKQKIRHTDQFRFLDKAAILDSQDAESGKALSLWNLCTVTEVEELKLIIRLLPIWATTILFYTAYAQQQTFSVEQGTTMDRRLGRIDIPAATMGAFLQAGIILTVITYDKFLIPLAKRITKTEKGITSLQRIAIGLFLAVLGMVSAALVEIQRLRVAESHKLTEVGPTGTTKVVPMSIFWLIPQFLLVGIGEGFIYVGQLDFFYNEAPPSMKSMAAGLFLSTISLGFFTSTALVAAVKRVTGTPAKPDGWLDNNLNQARLFDFYWFLALLILFNTLLYLLCAKWYKYKVRVQDDEEEVHKPTEDAKELSPL